MRKEGEQLGGRGGERGHNKLKRGVGKEGCVWGERVRGGGVWWVGGGGGTGGGGGGGGRGGGGGGGGLS